MPKRKNTYEVISIYIKQEEKKMKRKTVGLVAVLLVILLGVLVTGILNFY